MKVTIIGGGGKMGQWLCHFLADEDFDVIVADKDPEKLEVSYRSPHIETTQNTGAAVSEANIIIISVPINSFEKAVKDIAPHIRPGRIVLDITSFKAQPVAIMHKYIKKGLILGAHPLFGPNISSLGGQNIVFTPVNAKEKAFALEVKKYLEDRGAKVTLMEPEAHDRMMAVVQGLSHFVAIASADALSGLGELKGMKEVSTTTFNIFLNYIESVIGDDPELYAAIQMEHPEMPDIYKALTKSVEKLAGMVEKKDTQGFVKRMRALKKYLGK